MNEILTIFHGSNVVVESPKILVMGFYKDFGYGFYCTNLEKQAQKWAITKKGDSVVSVYQFQPNPTLKIKSFPTMTDEWLDFVVFWELAMNPSPPHMQLALQKRLLRLRDHHLEIFGRG